MAKNFGKGARRMRILTYNVHGWKTPTGESNISDVGAILRECAADLVALNEVFLPCEDSGENALARLAAELRMEWAFGGVQHGGYGNSYTCETQYGNACLSRYPISAAVSHPLPPGTAGGERILLEVQITAPGDKALTVYITHLDHRSEKHRLDQFWAVERLLERNSGQPHILVGDFNALAESDYVSPAVLAELSDLHSERGWPPPEFGLIRHILAAGYSDAAAECRTGSRPTWPAQQPERRVDYFFLSPQLVDQLVDCRPIISSRSLQGSDHLPLMLDLELR